MGQTSQSIIINKSAEEVWKAINCFQDMSWTPNVITSLEQVGDIPGDQVGSKRILNGAFHETLLSLDKENKTFTYCVSDGPSPISSDEVSNYVGKVVVVEVEEGQAKVEWTSTWENNDEAAQEFCHNIYMALLADMKKSLE